MSAPRSPRARRRRIRCAPVRAVLRVALATTLALCLAPGTVAAQSETPAERAAREIQAARDQANAAADAYFETESTLDELEEDLLSLRRQEEQLQRAVDQLRSEVEVVALARYVESGTEGIPLLTDVGDPQDQIQADVYVDVLTNSGADVLDRYESAEMELAANQREIAARQDEIEAERERFAELEEVALAEVDRLRAIEDERLEDEAVQKALEAQLAAERARLEEQARIDAEAAARARPNPGLVVPPSTEPPATTVAPAPATAAQTTPSGPDDGDAATTVGSVAPDPSGSSAPAPTAAPSTAPPSTSPPVTDPPETTIPESNGASGGTSGGRTGGGGGGNNPTAPPAGSGYVDGIVCPMPGSAYGDTWGAARSGGRRHEGVDMIAPRGIPIFAVVNGVATFKQNRLGGNAVSLVGDNGHRYYYAHLDRYAGSSRRVAQGELIGYNGDTGNARASTPHLHFEIHPGGGRAVNPYPSVRAAGC
ncbi:peptidoglycan DD-metalloendopeptidase family protein [Ilumatobacter sp.]|uniref:peptidoglycan DD-metalloendopeptidase family protein n=1 Tax=Ilumatobacter sp. TaxID=1967498 RepID=UPI003B518D0C